MVTKEFQATFGWAIIYVVFVRYCVGEFVHQDMTVLVNKVRHLALDERAEGGFRHQNGRSQSSRVVFQMILADFAQCILDGQAVFDCLAVGEKGSMDEQMAEFL